MNDVMNKYIELSVSIFIFIASITFLSFFLSVTKNPIIEVSTDKTLIESTGVQEQQYNDMYGKDILLMLLNTDEMCPYPRAIRINSGSIIKLDDTFIAYKMNYISNLYVNENFKDMLDYKVTSSVLVYDEDVPYIQYTLDK